MEGAVYRLEEGLVAKVWANRDLAGLDALKAFYEELAGQSLPFATPRIESVQAIAGAAVTYEAELPGAPLQALLADAGGDVVSSEAVPCMLEVLSALRNTTPGPATRRLAVLDESAPFVAGREFGTSLIAAMERRLTAPGALLMGALRDLPHLVAQIGAAVSSLNDTPSAIVHGDLCAANVLVDDALRPLAVLDWGFLSTAGDPRFDAAITAGILDMYGPQARAVETRLIAALRDAYGYDPAVLSVYRAAYAVLTCTAYDPSGRDGHFAWCLATLRRPDIRAAIAELA
jgi:aminoglycoside phosphotransferase